jgi:hypothetical protein
MEEECWAADKSPHQHTIEKRAAPAGLGALNRRYYRAKEGLRAGLSCFVLQSETGKVAEAKRILMTVT